MIDATRNEFLGLEDYVYLNAASQGLLPRRSVIELKWYAEQKYLGSMHWPEWYEKLEELRTKVSKLINASPEEIGFVPSTTYGINMLGLSIPWEKNENIVTTDMEFPANLFPWEAIARRYGLELRVIHDVDGAIRKEDFESTVDEKTRVIAVSWVEFSNGFVNDLKYLSKLAKENDAYLLVDGIQGIGALHFDAKEFSVDMVACGFQKWLLGTGSGFIYIRRDIIDELKIPFGGWLASKKPTDFSFRNYDPVETAKAFELGTPSFGDLLVANKSLELILELDTKNIERKNINLISYLRKKLEDIDSIKIRTPQNSRSSILLFETKNSKETYEKLINSKIIVSYRNGGIRVSPHFYNNMEDIDKLIEKIH